MLHCSVARTAPNHAAGSLRLVLALYGGRQLRYFNLALPVCCLLLKLADLVLESNVVQCVRLIPAKVIGWSFVLDIGSVETAARPCLCVQSSLSTQTAPAQASVPATHTLLCSACSCL